MATSGAPTSAPRPGFNSPTLEPANKKQKTTAHFEPSGMLVEGQMSESQTDATLLAAIDGMEGDGGAAASAAPAWPPQSRQMPNPTSAPSGQHEWQHKGTMSRAQFASLIEEAEADINQNTAITMESLKSLIGKYDRYVSQRMGQLESDVQQVKQEAVTMDKRLDGHDQDIAELRAILQANKSDEKGSSFLADEAWDRGTPSPVHAPASGATCGCGKPTWNGKWGEVCRQSCPGPRVAGPNIIVKLDPASTKYLKLAQYFKDTWDKEKRAKFPMPTIKDIWDITDDGLRTKFDQRCTAIGCVAIFGKGTSPGNVQRRFHGTRIKCSFAGSPCSTSGCGACGIINDGFLLKYAVPGTGRLFFGRGLYSTSASSSALRYAKDKKMKITGAIFVVQVACGKAEKLKGSDSTVNRLVDQDGPARGYDSRVIDKPHDAKCYKALADSSGDPLLYCDDELIVFHEEAMLPRYLITFQ